MILTTANLLLQAHEENFQGRRDIARVENLSEMNLTVWYAGTRAKYLYARRHERSLGIQHFRITNKKAVNHLVGSLA